MLLPDTIRIVDGLKRENSQVDFEADEMALHEADG
jgi:hypothetical protein